MKATPFLMACTFFLGALLTIVALSHLDRPAQAQDNPSPTGSAGGGNAAGGIVALPITVGSNKDFLVVFKEVDNPDGKAEPGEARVTAMAVYDFPQASPGNGKTEIALVASRFCEWDFKLYDFQRMKNDKTDVNEVKKAAETVAKKFGKK
jgi:hypothetical protein